MKILIAAALALAACFAPAAQAQKIGPGSLIFPFAFTAQATFTVVQGEEENIYEETITNRTLRLSEADLLNVLNAPKGTRLGTLIYEGSYLSIVVFNPANPGDYYIVGYAEPILDGVASVGEEEPEEYETIDLPPGALLNTAASKTALAHAVYALYLYPDRRRGIGAVPSAKDEERPANGLVGLEVEGLVLQRLLVRKIFGEAGFAASAVVGEEVLKISPNPLVKKLPVSNVPGNLGGVEICEEVFSEEEEEQNTAADIETICTRGLANQVFFTADFTTPIGMIPEWDWDAAKAEGKALRARHKAGR